MSGDKQCNQGIVIMYAEGVDQGRCTNVHFKLPKTFSCLKFQCFPSGSMSFWWMHMFVCLVLLEYLLCVLLAGNNLFFFILTQVWCYTCTPPPSAWFDWKPLSWWSQLSCTLFQALLPFSEWPCWKKVLVNILFKRLSSKCHNVSRFISFCHLAAGVERSRSKYWTQWSRTGSHGIMKVPPDCWRLGM